MTGRITSKGYMYYMILNLKDEDGRYKQKWIRTGLSTRLDGNRERAEGMLYERLKGNFLASEQRCGDIGFKVLVCPKNVEIHFNFFPSITLELDEGGDEGSKKTAITDSLFR